MGGLKISSLFVLWSNFRHNPRFQLPPRLLRWCLKMQQYNFNVLYHPGNQNPADNLFRHPPSSLSPTKPMTIIPRRNTVEHFAINAIPAAIPLEHVKEKTLNDITLQKATEPKRHTCWDRIFLNHEGRSQSIT